MKQRFRISGQFIMMLGTFVSVFVSFYASISIIGKSGNLLYIILLFVIFFVVLFLPLSFAARPMIEMDAIRKYIDKMNEKVKMWSFNKDDMINMRRLKKLIIEKDKRRYLVLLARVVFIMSEMEKIEKARTSFYWENQRDILH
jgi:hypothetical protein